MVRSLYCWTQPRDPGSRSSVRGHSAQLFCTSLGLKVLSWHYTAYLLSGSVVRPCGRQPTRLLCPSDFSGKNTGVGCHFLLQGIFLTQRWNSHLFCLLAGGLFTSSATGSLCYTGSFCWLFILFFALKFFLKYVFIWLLWVLVAAHRISDLCCSMWDLVP